MNKRIVCLVLAALVLSILRVVWLEVEVSDMRMYIEAGCRGHYQGSGDVNEAPE